MFQYVPSMDCEIDLFLFRCLNGTIPVGPLEKTTPECVNHEIKMLQKLG